jgi:ATP-dependent Clp protease ATP-binding subunit ClpA
VIILTSNVGSTHIMAIDDPAAMRAAVMDELRQRFRPEFLNRLDETVIFHRLTREDVRKVVEVQIGLFAKRLGNRDLTLDIIDAAKDFLGNVGSHHLSALGDNPTHDDEVRANAMVMEELRRAFRPEFLNRLDETVIFHRLKKEQIRSIVDIQLKNFTSRLARRELKADFTTAAKDYLGEVGWDPQYGARPLKRAIQRHVEDPLARKLLGGDFPPGTTIEVDRDPEGDLKFGARMTN